MTHDYLKNGTIWYHGTTTQHLESIDKIEVERKQKKALDFGIGFYLTTQKEQAIKWANHKAKTYNSFCGDIVQPLLVSYRIDFDKIKFEGFTIQDFSLEISEEFMTFVALNRIGLKEDILTGNYKGNLHSYDIIFGTVVDGKPKNIVSTLEKYGEFKNLSEAKNKLFEKVDKLGYRENQLCICNQDIIKFLEQRGKEICLIEQY
ncbi:DUF3990 domain-containing protein [Enterococcus faecalis]|uniref:DUF3990 domain-containing protein n=1 Tax=Enterococcus faecalis TaxID=1351 RepID=UPI0019F9D9C2|nr:DUF3990 domain-containing protein [Enterococcus faecalis]EKO5651397.1 DUF3990 domain-containing protein [Enterococcus faecalis]